MSCAHIHVNNYHMFQNFIKHIRRESKYYAAVLRIGIPLIISMSATTLMLFTDRMFLGRYSVDAIAAAGPAGAMAFTFLAFFGGIGSYTGTFVAQYFGARQFRQIGLTLWQAQYFAISAGALLALGATMARPIFEFIGHAAVIREQEIAYFRILMLGGITHVWHDVLASYFSGRGVTRPIMLVSIIGTMLNIPLDYLLINGCWIIPEMGIKGAAWATVISHAFICILLAAMIFRRRNETLYGILSQRRFHWGRFRRLMRFGLPNGVQMTVDNSTFLFLLLIIGQLGRMELAVSNIIFSINSLVFMPMIGLSIAVATLVGQTIGKGEPEEGVRFTRKAMHITMLYMGGMALWLVVFPHPILRLFLPADSAPAEAAEILSIGKTLLVFVAIYSILDTMNVIYSGALRGAGDVRFVTWAIAILSFGIMLLPAWIAVEWFGGGIYTVWVIVSFYICVLALVFRYRFRQGRWKSMHVIERPVRPTLGGIGRTKT
ncbi:MAG: MATE family efflux transporter [Kiritimatiellia bacterium]